MARLALLAFGMLLTCAAWLWWHLDPATIAPAMAAAESSYTAAEPSSPLVAKGRRVPSAEPPSAAAGHASTSLASPERRAVVKNAKRYVIHGVVTRGGVGQPGREVLCSGGRGQKPATAVTGRDGVFAFEVDPGEYELYTPHTLGTTRQQAAYKRFPPSGRDRLAAAICSCVIESEDVDVTLQLSQNSLTVIVRNAKTFESIHWATATWQPPVPEQDELRIPADQGGRVRFSDVRPGKGSVVVSARAFVGAAKSVDVVAAQGDQVLEFLLEPACAVDVVMVDEQRRAIAVSRAQVLALHPSSERSAARHREREQRLLT